MLEQATEVAREGGRADPPLDPPGELQPFLGFRALPRYARAVVARVLDTDEAFRTRVLDSIPADDLDGPGRLYLARPEGWRDELAALAAERTERERAEAEERHERSVARELERAEARVADLEQLARESAADVTRLAAELGEVRRDRRRLVEELDAAVARLESVEAGQLEAQRRAEEAEAAMGVRERELTEARHRLEEVEAELDRRPLPPDEAPPTVAAEALEAVLTRLRSAVGQAQQALTDAEGLVPEAPRAAGEPARPSAPTLPARRRPTPLPGGLRDDSVEAARYLMRQPGMTVLVDGYNVSMRAWPEADIAEQRRRLVQGLGTLAARTDVEPVIVFDGASGVAPVAAPPRRQVRVRFTAGDVEADDELLELIEHHPVAEPVCVVSSDRRVADGGRARGANVLSAEQLIALLAP